MCSHSIILSYSVPLCISNLVNHPISSSDLRGSVKEEFHVTVLIYGFNLEMVNLFLVTVSDLSLKVHSHLSFNASKCFNFE